MRLCTAQRPVHLGEPSIRTLEMGDGTELVNLHDVCCVMHIHQTGGHTYIHVRALRRVHLNIYTEMDPILFA